MVNLIQFRTGVKGATSRPRRGNITTEFSSEILQDVMIALHSLAFIITLAAIGKNVHDATINF
jgi:hypothetical protein